MTRETKVGLLVGMGVILLIGIIVSDQLAHIQREEAADLTEFAADAQQSINPLGQPTPSIDAAADARADFLTPPAARRSDFTPAIDLDADDDQPAPAIRPQTEARRNTVLEYIALNTGPDEPTDTADDQSPTDLPVERTVSETIIPLTERPAPLRDRRAEPAQPLTHTVVEGDNLYRIAQKYLGDGNRWRRIADANPGKVDNDGQVRAGVTLTIPGTTASSDLDSPTIENRTAATAARAAKSKIETSRTYTVRTGDSLFSIARTQLGDGGSWKRIYEANRDRISDPDRVKVGTELRIPGS